MLACELKLNASYRSRRGSIPNSQDGEISVCPVFDGTFKVAPGAALAW